MHNLYQKDCLSTLRDIETNSVGLVLTSPPYNIGKQYEKDKLLSFEDYIDWQSLVIKECARICSDNGSICWQVGNYINKEGDIYPLDCALFPCFIKHGLKPRNRIVWTFDHGLHCKNRFSGRHETILWFSKTSSYIFNLDPVRIPQKYKSKKHYKGPKKGQLSCNPLGKNPSDVWPIPNVKNNHPEKTKHECQYPYELAARLVLSLTNEDEMVVDPFMGSGTTGVAAIMHNRKFIGCDLDSLAIEIAKERLEKAENGEILLRTGFYSDEDVQNANNTKHS